MTFVEHKIDRNYPSFTWAADITVQRGEKQLEIAGRVPISQEDRLSAPDVLRAYRSSLQQSWSVKRIGKNSPHIKFANATNDERLIKFVQTFGPVVVDSARTEEREIAPDGPFDFGGSVTFVIARQDLAELRAEHRAYRAALRLVSALLGANQPNLETIRMYITEIVENAADWPRQWERERQLRASGQGYADKPLWTFGANNFRHLTILKANAMLERSGDRLRDALSTIDPVHAGHSVICELINSFDLLVYPWGNIPIEAPDWDLAGGIRPILYYILRREYLRQVGGIAICRRTECRELFEIERSGQEFCSSECSRLQRQREYWKTSGKKLRQRRLKASKNGREDSQRSNKTREKRKAEKT